MARQPTRPRTVAELLRWLDDRLRTLEHRTHVQIGTPPNAYVVEVDDAGRLVARHGTTGTVTVLAEP